MFSSEHITSSGTHKELLISMCKRLFLNRSSKDAIITHLLRLRYYSMSMVWGHIASSTRVLYMWHRIWYVPALYFHLSIGQLSTRSLKKEGRKTLTVSRTHTYRHMQIHIHTKDIQHTHTPKETQAKQILKSTQQNITKWKHYKNWQNHT